MKRFRPAPWHSRPPVGSSAFSLIELLVVIAIIGILAGLLVGLAPAAMQRARESRVRTELKALEGYIEGYKYKYGVYPPDGLKIGADGLPEHDRYGNLVIQPHLNPLFYELTGLVVSNAYVSTGFFLPLGDELSGSPNKILSANVHTWFGRDGFVNAVSMERRRSLFRAEFKESAAAEIFSSPAQPGYVDLRVLAVGWAGDAHRPSQLAGLVWPNNTNFPPPIPTNPRLNPWRYVSSNPTNNPGRFDLWAEYIEKGQKKIVANWRQ